MKQIQFKQTHSYLYTKGRASTIKYIVLHYTANKGDTAKNNATYFSKRQTRRASAHYFVDENYIWQGVKDTDTAFHCGGSLQGSAGHSFYNICKNSNSIGIEMCLWDKKGNVRQGSIDTAVELTRWLMQQYDVPADRVIRHWDVTGKQCPAPMTGDNNTLWKTFKARISEEEIDMEELQKLRQELEELKSLRSEFESFRSQSAQTIQSLSTSLAAANEYAARLAARDEQVFATFEDIPQWGQAAIDKLIQRGALTGDALNLRFDVVRMFTLLDRLGLIKATPDVFAKIEDIPEWGRATIQTLLDREVLAGTGNGEVNISMDMLRTCVILDNAGAFELEHVPEKITKEDGDE